MHAGRRFGTVGRRLLLAALLANGCAEESVLQFDPGGEDPTGAPSITGPARYEDHAPVAVPRTGERGAGDLLIVPFSRSVTLAGATVDDFFLFQPTEESSCDPPFLGVGAFLREGPAANEITIVLGDGTLLRTRGAHDPSSADCLPPSGLGLTTGTGIVNPVDGSAAEPSAPVDVVPAFVESRQDLGDGATLAVALGDLDGDGDLDLVEGEFRGLTSIRLGDGSRDFGSPSQLVGGGSTRAVLLVDVDRDGDLDLVLGNAAPEADELWTNDGGTFTLRQVFGACDTWALAAGDVDGDGDPDLVAADGAAPNVVWRNVAGRFVLGQELIDDACLDVPCPSPTRDVVLADVDGDGDLDLIEGDWGEPDRLRRNDGTGLFEDSLVLSLERGATTSLAVGDVDLDGDLDLVVGDGQGADRIWTNVDGVLVDSGQRLGIGETRDVALADLDGDGALDLVTASSGGGNRYRINDHTGLFLDTHQRLGSGRATSLALGDVDRDSDVDVLVGNENEPDRLWLQSLAGTWGTVSLDGPTDLGQGTTYWDVEAVDVDQDGDPDLVASGPGVSSAIWRNDGPLGFSRIQALTPAVDSRSIAVGDIDGDGDPDLVQGSHGDPSPDRLWLNDGRGSFSSTSQLTNSHSSLDLILADLDGDGTPDLVQSDDDDRVLKVWTNAAGVFTDTLQPFDGGPTSPGATLALAIGDLNRDGFPDLVEAHDVELGRVWRNDGAARFTLIQRMVLSSSVLGVALGDLDLDGDPDLVCTDQAAAGIGDRVWFNEDGGVLMLSSLSLPGTFLSVALADLDGDGDLDILSGGLGTSSAWFRNDGPGGFAPPETLIGATTRARRVCAADLDLDADLEVVFAVRGANDPLGRLSLWFDR